MRTVFCVLAGAALVVCGTSSAVSVGAAYSVVVQPNGKIVVAGWGQRGAQDVFGLARYTRGGSLDKRFGLRGKVTLPIGRGSQAIAAALQPDGKLVAAGYEGGELASSFKVALARYTARGRLDGSFGKKGRVTTKFGSVGSIANDVIVQPDGKIVAAGGTLDANGSFALARYTPSGKLDPTFGSGGRVQTVVGPSAFASALALQPDGKIVVVGTWGEQFGVVRYTTDGSLDSSFGTDGVVSTPFPGSAEAYAIALQDDGKIVVAGAKGTGPAGAPGYEFALARYNSDGSLDNSFGSGGLVTTSFFSGSADLPYGGVANAVAIQTDGKIVAGGGQLIPYPGRGNFALARYNPDGSLDSGFGDGGKVTTSFGYSPPENPTEDGDVIDGLALQPDGKIVAAGYSQFGPHTEQYKVAVARYGSDGSLDPGFGSGGKVSTSLAVCVVPKLTGRKMDWFAQQYIKGAHCAVGKNTRVHSHFKRRRIISERPRPGTVHVEGTKVRIFVSLGR